MKNLLLYSVLLSIVIIFNVPLYGQEEVTLTFTGESVNGNYLQLNQVVIENQTRGWMDVITMPDTIYTLVVGTSVPSYTSSPVISAMPNPFEGTARVNVKMPKADHCLLQLTDMGGRCLSEYNGHLDEGDNIFSISLDRPQTCILTVESVLGRSQLKMVNVCHGGATKISKEGSGVNLDLPLKNTTSHPFQLGDVMKYVGRVLINGALIQSIPVVQTQSVSQTITLIFSMNDAQPCPGVPTVTDYDGNTYATLQIGNQCWMRESLKTTHYADGTEIPINTVASLDTAFLYVPNGDVDNVTEYGLVYNWLAAMHGASSSTANPSGVQGVCPTGWHLPSHAEWTQLTDYISNQNYFFCGMDDSYIAKSLASTWGWQSSNVACSVGFTPSANNSTGFAAVPTGCFNSYYGFYCDFGNHTYFWSATEYDDDYAFSRILIFNSPIVENVPVGNGKDAGFSVRCIRD